MPLLFPASSFIEIHCLNLSVSYKITPVSPSPTTVWNNYVNCPTNRPSTASGNCKSD